MSNYLDENLIGAERVAYRGYVHPVTYTRALLFGAAACGVFAFAASLPTRLPVLQYVGWLLAAVAIAYAIWARTLITTSEFAVTDRRVIIHVGLFKKTSQELFLTKVEGISINQSLLGRLLNFGDISIRGGGGLQEDLNTVASPYRFRRHVEMLANEYAHQQLHI